MDGDNDIILENNKKEVIKQASRNVTSSPSLNELSSPDMNAVNKQKGTSPQRRATTEDIRI